MNKEQAKMILSLNYHHNADKHEKNWDTFRNKDGMTYYTPSEIAFKVTINPYEEDKLIGCLSENEFYGKFDLDPDPMLPRAILYFRKEVKEIIVLEKIERAPEPERVFP